MPHANTEAMNADPLEISQHVTPGAHAILVLDGAGGLNSQSLGSPDSIPLMQAASTLQPELNPAENLGQYFRQTNLTTRVFDSYADIVDACCTAWNNLMAMPRRSHRSPSAIGRRPKNNAAGIRK